MKKFEEIKKYLNKMDTVSAEKWLNKHQSLSTDIEYINFEGILAFQKGDISTAIECFKKVVFKNKHRNATYNLAYCYKEKKQYNLAVKYYRELIENEINDDISKQAKKELKELELQVSKRQNVGCEIIQIETENMQVPESGNTYQVTRKKFYDSIIQQSKAKVSIFVVVYNRLDKTKRCIESILNYTEGIDYELILIDNGSNDEVHDYLQSVPYINKKIVKITKNIGLMYAVQTAMKLFDSEYFVLIPNDVYVTKNWLSNLIKCYESDASIGMVCPVSSNVSNLQEVSLQFNNYEEMQQYAEGYNISDQKRWEERLRLINIVTVLKREVIDNVGLFDVGFYHDFGEDDYSIRIRRAGYRLILCKDTFVHHDHDFRQKEDKNILEFEESLRKGRESYLQKYHGLDAWDDMNNYESEMIQRLPKIDNIKNVPEILGIDVKCGTPILEIKNHLRKNMIFDTHTYAFTTKAKYYQDLSLLTDEKVSCDRIEFVQEHFRGMQFDYIVLGEPINSYKEPIRLLDRLYGMLSPNGYLLLKLSNVLDIRMLLNVLGLQKQREKKNFFYLEEGELKQCIRLIGGKLLSSGEVYHSITRDTLEEIGGIVNKAKITDQVEKCVEKMCIKEFVFCIRKEMVKE